MDPSGAGSYMITGQPYIETIVNYTTDLYCVWGRVDKPNASMTLELERGGVIYPRDPSRPITSDPGNIGPGGNFCYALWFDFGNGIEGMHFEPGDILRLYTDSWSGEVVFKEIHVTPDAVLNQIDGAIIDPPVGGEVAVQVFQSENNFFVLNVASESRSPVSGGNYLTTFDNFDVHAAIYMNTFFYDPDTGFGNQLNDQNHWFLIIDNLAVTGHTYIPDEPITLRLLDPATLDPIYTSTNDLEGNPYSFYFDFKDCNPVCAPNPPLQPGTIVEMDYGFSGDGDRRLTYEPISVDGNPDTDHINGYGKNGNLIMTAGFDAENFHNWAPAISLEGVINTSAFGYDLAWGDSATMIYNDPLGNFQWNSKLLGEIRRVEFWFNPDDYVSIWGNAQPSSEVVVKTSRGDTLYGYTEALNGNFGADHATLLLPGDKITVTAGAGIYPVFITIPDIWANSNSSNETVSGHTGIYKETEVEIYPSWTGEMYTTTTTVDGEFSTIFPNIPPQGRGYIRFTINAGPPTSVDAIFHRPFYDLEPNMQVNYAHDWVEGQYDPGVDVDHGNK